MIVPNPEEMRSAVSVMRNTRVLETREHLRLAADWLLTAQGKAGEGYAHSYHLLRGWSAAYPETTGYIIPSMLELSGLLGDNALSDSAVKAGRWLLSIQNDDGSFSDLHGKRQVFDTGQIIYGLLSLHGRDRKGPWMGSAVRAGEWLVSVQEKDGSWAKNSYNQVPHTYYSRVGSILIELGMRSGEKGFIASGKKNLDWVVSRQHDDGYLSDMAFDPGSAPYLHTIAYVIEGLLHGYSSTGSKAFLDPALKAARSLRRISSERDFILRSQYSDGWDVANPEKCVTGLAQWSGICLRLFAITKDISWRDEAIKTIYYLKAKQVQGGTRNVRGGLPSSIPVWGKYGKFSFFNWNSKFFIDALLSLDKLSIPLWMEQQVYVQEAFIFSERRYYNPHAKADYSPYLSYFGKVIPKLKENAVFADIGCGGGALLRELGARYQKVKFIGIDPSFKGKGISPGSAYSTSLPDSSVDAMLLKEVLQHTAFDEVVFSELRRIAKDGAILMIIERNPSSLLGMRKPLYENVGKWMYPPDSPFRERWHPESAWRKMLSQIGDVLSVDKINLVSGGRRVLAGYDSRFFFITVRLKKSPG